MIHKISLFVHKASILKCCLNLQKIQHVVLRNLTERGIFRSDIAHTLLFLSQYIRRKAISLLENIHIFNLFRKFFILFLLFFYFFRRSTIILSNRHIFFPRVKFFHIFSDYDTYVINTIT